MKITQEEMNELKSMLKRYTADHGDINMSSDSLNCYCAANCTSTCVTYCDGSAIGGGLCWQSGGRR